ncbi:Trypsin-like peptidase domain-containing protein [Sphingomonas sp. OV641]|uniref:trypsin-like serine peptidase n=1 Tax=Sphingomonas sp. OV641 TaxID=1881068 RepID=UPI0008AF384A|nr:serine protease [Sphingomonas sp. OV641]SEJ83430.1 Trypsin-like peptidase domain-containing protein [Sphingomonas sp. OV641]
MSDSAQELVITGGRWSLENQDTPAVLPTFDFDFPSTDAEFVILPGAKQRNDVTVPKSPPFAGIVLLNFFFKKKVVRVGTGFFCDQRVVLTARHNLEPATYDSAGVWVAFDASRNPSAQRLTILSHAKHPVLDLCVLITKEDAPGVFRLAANGAPPSHGAAVAGYGFPYSNGHSRLSVADGPVLYGQDHAIGYKINTRPGDSGAPIFHATGGTTAALGIHTEAPAGGSVLNAGLRFDDAILAEVANLIAFAQSSVP